MLNAAAGKLAFPHPSAPAPNSVVPIAPGIVWIRLALPFALDHVNVYLIEDGGGWALVDTGIRDDRTIAAWEELLDGELRDKPISRLIVTHFHSDHSGMAGWLCRRLRVPLYITHTEYLRSAALLQERHSDTSESWNRFYQRAGLSAERTGLIARSGHRYMQHTTGLIPARILAAGDALTIGQRKWHALTGAGHSPEQLMLYCPADGVLLSADHILARISPNVSVYHAEPEADPLGQYLTSLDDVPQSVDRDVLVLPGHNLPFRGLHARTAQLKLHHAARCDLIEAACRSAPQTVADLLPVLFPRPLDPQQTSFAIGEAFAHVNYMVARRRLASSGGHDGGDQYRAV